MGSATYYLSYDQVGSLRLVADASGNVVKRISYDSFGNILEDTNPSFTIPFGFAGGLHDRDTGLVRFGYRDYDPEVGRWTAKDPIGFNSGDTDLYGYVVNNPVNAIDPYGLTMRDACKGAIFGFRASGVVIRETAKMVAVDVGFALINYIPLPPGVSFWSGRGLSIWVIDNNFIGMEQLALQISQEIQSIRDEIFPNIPPSVSDSFWDTGTP